MGSRAFERFTYEEADDNFNTVTRFHGDEAGESLAATLASVFAARGDDFAMGLLINATHRLEEWTFKSTGTFSKYQWHITVAPPLYALYREQDESETQDFDERDDFAMRAWRLGGPLMENIALADIIVAPALSTDPKWRERARLHLSGLGVNNQGNVHALKRPKILHDELWFRHIEEQYIYEALLRRGYPFMPLPVVVRADGTKRPNGVNRRIEPDFCVLFKGRLVVLEVDGGSHWETPVDADKRLLFLREQGAIIRRIPADNCGDIEKAVIAVSDAFKSISAEIQRGAV